MTRLQLDTRCKKLPGEKWTHLRPLGGALLSLKTPRRASEAKVAAAEEDEEKLALPIIE